MMVLYSITNLVMKIKTNSFVELNSDKPNCHDPQTPGLLNWVAMHGPWMPVACNNCYKEVKTIPS